MNIKKLAFIFAIPAVLLGALFSFDSLPSASEEGITWAELPENNPLKHKKLIKDNQNLQRLFLFSNSVFNNEEAYSIIKTISSLPPFMHDRLVHHNVRIKLFTGSLTDNRSARHLKGEKPRGYTNSEHTWDDVPGMGGTRNVLVKIGASGKGSGHGSVSLELHELAHTLDTIVYGNIREDEGFLRIWKEEAPKLFPGRPYFLTHPEEYFAESFAMYYYKNARDKTELQTKAPKTYFFIKQLD
ncbi:toxin [Bacillus sp. V59.32b]|uniref:anthrax toxin lethal factor-related metalloendopeptidase n=1 Tax=Bacillus sp. V59.32b TaxID=1758642 RepID=UPI000E3D92AD|nr:toxin [Bacillus sp. V59.32b]RFU61699.1 toxin [Bacillus sp. V59.32b]